MNLKDYLFDDDRGVSPVIGVILMVAITVILAAVIATFVMNMGPNESTPANANWDASFDVETGSDDSFTLTHEGGGEAQANEYVLSLEGATDWDPSAAPPSGTSIGSADFNLGSNLSAPSEMTASDSVTLDETSLGTSLSNNFNLSAATVQLVWEDPEGDQSQIIDTYEP